MYIRSGELQSLSWRLEKEKILLSFSRIELWIVQLVAFPLYWLRILSNSGDLLPDTGLKKRNTTERSPVFASITEQKKKRNSTSWILNHCHKNSTHVDETAEAALWLHEGRYENKSWRANNETMGACYVAIPIMLHGTRKCVGFEAILESK